MTLQNLMKSFLAFVKVMEFHLNTKLQYSILFILLHNTYVCTNFLRWFHVIFPISYHILFQGVLVQNIVVLTEISRKNLLLNVIQTIFAKYFVKLHMCYLTKYFAKIVCMAQCGNVGNLPPTSIFFVKSIYSTIIY